MGRFVVLDTETTGFTRKKGIPICHDHRIVEVACVEIDDGVRTGSVFHEYVNPGRNVDPAAVRVHGITDTFLRDKPSFKDVVGKMLDFIGRSPVVIHNAPFDIAFLDKEFSCWMINLR
jgi:DNA polymerase-3 subunit epsilon